MTERQARLSLKDRGRVIYRGWEIWETVNGQGYTGKYRLAPAGHREEWPAYEETARSLVSIFTHIEQGALPHGTQTSTP